MIPGLSEVGPPHDPGPFVPRASHLIARWSVRSRWGSGRKSIPYSQDAPASKAVGGASATVRRLSKSGSALKAADRSFIWNNFKDFYTSSIGAKYLSFHEKSPPWLDRVKGFP